MTTKQCAFPDCANNYDKENSEKGLHYCSFSCYAEHASKLKKRASDGLYDAIVDVLESKFTEEELNILFRNNVFTIYNIAEKMRDASVEEMSHYFVD